MRPLTPAESRDLAALAARADAVAPIHITAVQLEKSIIDATAPIRRALVSAGIHDYGPQGQGRDVHGVVLTGTIHDDNSTAPIRVSAYRPKSKDGDTRFWPLRDFKQRASDDEIWGLACNDGHIHLAPLGRDAGGFGGPLSPAAASAVAAMSVEFEVESAGRLMAALNALRGKSLVAEIRGDTAVGMTVERELKITPNNSGDPDWESKIEVKSKREQSHASNNTLKSLVPLWSRSPLGHRALVLKRYGRPNAEGQLRLTNTLSALRANSHGLRLRVDHDSDQLWAYDEKTGEGVVVWEMALLRERIGAKHAETMWIKAATLRVENGYEVFMLTEAEHTARPRVWALGALIESGVITVDFTLSLKPGGTVRDHGWLFRIAPSDRGLMFPVVTIHNLRADPD
jgi:hypothetical protein